MNARRKYSLRAFQAGLLALVMLVVSPITLAEGSEQVFRIDGVDAGARALSVRGEDVQVSEQVIIDRERASGARNPIRFEDLEPRQYVRLTIRQGRVTRITVLEGFGTGDGVL